MRAARRAWWILTGPRPPPFGPARKGKGALPAPAEGIVRGARDTVGHVTAHEAGGQGEARTADGRGGPGGSASAPAPGAPGSTQGRPRPAPARAAGARSGGRPRPLGVTVAPLDTAPGPELPRARRGAGRPRSVVLQPHRP